MALTFNEMREGMQLETKSFSISDGEVRHHLKIYGSEFGMHTYEKEVPLTLLLSRFAGGCFLKPALSCREVRSVEIKMQKKISVDEAITPGVRVTKLLPENRQTLQPAGFAFLEVEFKNGRGEICATAKLCAVVNHPSRQPHYDA